MVPWRFTSFESFWPRNSQEMSLLFQGRVISRRVISRIFQLLPVFCPFRYFVDASDKHPVYGTPGTGFVEIGNNAPRPFDVPGLAGWLARWQALYSAVRMRQNALKGPVYHRQESPLPALAKKITPTFGGHSRVVCWNRENMLKLWNLPSNMDFLFFFVLYVSLKDRDWLH